jgi:hypothetical protein
LSGSERTADDTLPLEVEAGKKFQTLKVTCQHLISDTSRVNNDNKPILLCSFTSPHTYAFEMLPTYFFKNL